MYLDISDLEKRDELLGADVTPELLKEAEDELKELAILLNVKIEDITSTTSVKRFIRAYVYREVAKCKTFGTAAPYGTDEKTVDVYGEKLKLYTTELETLKNTLSAQSLTGKVETRGFRAVNIYRG